MSRVGFKILVTGADGQLGRAILENSNSYRDSEFVFSTREDMDLINQESILDYLNSVRPQLIIHAAAYTAVDRAEEEPVIADAINHLAADTIAEWCENNLCKLIYISTDYVFDGRKDELLSENETPNPVNVYGLSKWKGEQVIMQRAVDSIIIRTSWVYYEHGNNFVKTMIRLMRERDSISVVNDQFGSPTYAGDLASAILELIHNREWVNGIYHYSNTGRITWYDFADSIRTLGGFGCEVRPIDSEAYPTKAKRPKYSGMNSSKFEDTFSIEIPNWKNRLSFVIDKFLVS